jgi:hypothetical protein
MSYKGRPSNLSRARRRNETGPQLNTALYQSIMTQIEVMNPGEHIVISPDKAQQIRLNTIRVRLYGYNERYSTNFVVHKHTDGSVYIWYNPAPPIPKEKQHNIPHKREQTPGSIHAPLFAILKHLNMTREAFEALPWDRQMTLRINAGIAIRNERKKHTKLGDIFKSPSPDTSDS